MRSGVLNSDGSPAADQVEDQDDDSYDDQDVDEASGDMEAEA